MRQRERERQQAFFVFKRKPFDGSILPEAKCIGMGKFQGAAGHDFLNLQLSQYPKEHPADDKLQGHAGMGSIVMPQPASLQVQPGGLKFPFQKHKQNKENQCFLQVSIMLACTMPIGFDGE